MSAMTALRGAVAFLSLLALSACDGGRDDTKDPADETPTSESACDDGVDEDLDGATDCDDADCTSDAACPELACDDGADNDADGGADCLDADCAAAEPCACLVGAGDLGSAVGDSVATGTTDGAGDDSAPSCVTADDSGAVAASGPDVAWLWTAPDAATWRFTTEGSSFDSVIYVLDGTCAGAELACNDNATSATGLSAAEAALSAGQVVVITIDGYDEFSQGAWQLNISRASR